jgi:phosphoribosyl-ATP pyrophosphohydrolase
MSDSQTVFQRLMEVIEDRRRNPPAKSYTTTLFQGGVARIGSKILEEAAEVVQAAGEPPSAEARKHVVHEAADLLYHLFVLLGHQEIPLREVEAELARRFGISGLDEKASRKQDGPADGFPESHHP